MKGCAVLPIALIILATGNAEAEEKPDPSISYTLSAGEEPQEKVWTQPASVSYTSSKAAKDSWAIDLVGKIEGQPFESLPDTFFVSGKVLKNTQQSKELQNYGLEVGYSFDFDTAGHDETTDNINQDAWYFFNDVSIAYSDKRVFADPKAVCDSEPLPPACLDQDETSLRAMIKLMPFHDDWEDTFNINPETKALEGPPLAYSFSPVVTLFRDDIISSKVNANGIKPDGVVSGVKLEIGAAISPRFTKYRATLRASYQSINAFERDTSRRASFDRSSQLYKISLDYDLGVRSFDDSGGWVPAFGISYTKGDDPLLGRVDLESTSVNFKISYRGAK